MGFEVYIGTEMFAARMALHLTFASRSYSGRKRVCTFGMARRFGLFEDLVVLKREKFCPGSSVVQLKDCLMGLKFVFGTLGDSERLEL